MNHTKTDHSTEHEGNNNILELESNFQESTNVHVSARGKIIQYDRWVTLSTEQVWSLAIQSRIEQHEKDNKRVDPDKVPEAEGQMLDNVEHCEACQEPNATEQGHAIHPNKT